HFLRAERAHNGSAGACTRSDSARCAHGRRFGVRAAASRNQKGDRWARRRKQATGSVHAHPAAAPQVGALSRRRCRWHCGRDLLSHGYAHAGNKGRRAMISLIDGVLTARHLDRVEILTDGGVGYELAIPLSVLESLPREGERVRLHTWLVVKDDGWQLFGFSNVHERRVFQRLLGATGFGPALALAMLSTLSASRVVRAIREKDIATLQGVPRVGRKKAERLVLDLGDKVEDLQLDDSSERRPEGEGAEDAVRALVSLGYSQADAERGVRSALDRHGAGATVAELIRAALAAVG